MKTFSIILTAAITAILFAAGCVNEEPAYKNEPGTTPAPEDGTGYLSMAGMTMRVISDDTSSETVKPQTRAEEAQPDVDAFIVEIFDAEGTTVYKDTYANLRTETAATDGKMELPTGSYKLEVRSEEPSSKLAEWDHPVYFAARDFAIEKNEDTVLEEIVCTLSNIKVTLTCSKDLADQFTAETISTVSLGETSMVFVKGETRAAYFTSLAELNTLKFNLTGAFADTPETPLQFNKEIPNVKAGQWRKITLVITYADKGGIKFDIDVKNFIMDEEIRIDGTANVWEPIFEEGPDPLAPAIEWPGHDLTEPFRITSSMFDADGKCTEPFALNLTAPNGIESLVLTFSSTNSAFMDALTEIQIPHSLDLCATTQGPAYAILSGFGLPLGDKLRGATSKQFDIAGQIPMLYADPGFEGTHTFACTLTDAKGLSTSAELRLVVSKSSADAPSIKWVGYEIDEQQPLTHDMKIDIDIQVPAGIKKFEVTIISEILDPLLEEMKIPAQFDLCNLGSETEPLIKELGFPTNEEVRNKTSFDPLFSITDFVEMIFLVFDSSGKESGTFDFRLSITDNKDQLTTKTIQLKAVKEKE